MAVKRHVISPDLVIHPGETIYDLLQDRGITQKELALRAGVSEPFLSDVIRGKKDISKSLALGLQYAFGVPSSFWLNLQANYDAEILALREIESITDEERTVLTNISEVVNYLKKYSYISDSDKQEQLILDLRKYFHVSNLIGLRKLVTMSVVRKEDKAAVNSDVLVAWFCLCEIQGDEMKGAEQYVPEQIRLLTQTDCFRL